MAGPFNGHKARPSRPPPFGPGSALTAPPSLPSVRVRPSRRSIPSLRAGFGPLPKKENTFFCFIFKRESFKEKREKRKMKMKKRSKLQLGWVLLTYKPKSASHFPLTTHDSPRNINQAFFNEK